MTGDWLVILIGVAALGSGLVAGVFFAFSAFVMQALARLPPAQGIAAMQAINVVVLRSAFMPLFLGTALLCATVAVLSLQDIRLLTGSLLFLAGSFGVTILLNVPLNRQLARAAPKSAAGAALWAHYLRRWMLWNHLRMLASLAAAALLTVAAGAA